MNMKLQSGWSILLTILMIGMRKETISYGAMFIYDIVWHVRAKYVQMASYGYLI